MSEDAQEACHKFFNIYRVAYARKNYRQKTMEDVFKRFLISSDPYIFTCRKLPVKLNNRFGELHNNNLYAISTYLDPKYKTIFLNEITKERIELALHHYINQPTANR